MRRNGRFLILSGGLLLALALLLTAYNLWDQRRAAEAVQTVLVQLLPQIQPSSSPSEWDGEAEPDRSCGPWSSGATPAFCPSPPWTSAPGGLGLELPYAEDLPCGMPVPHPPKNLVIAGHNYPSHLGV